MPSNCICALDISTSKISAAVAEIKKRRIVNIFFEAMPSKGIRKGAVVDSVGLMGSIENVLKSLKRKSGLNIKFIYANISGADIVARHSRAIIPLAERGNKVITLSDMQKVNEQARILGSNLEEEIIHQVIHNYSIDSNSNILNPLGLYSHRLAVDLYLICGRLTFLQNLIHAVNQSGYEIKKIFFSGLASSCAVFSKELKEGVSLLCDIGADITELLLFNDGILNDIGILGFGGDDLTVELSGELKISFDLAEDVKRSCGVVGNYNEAGNDKETLVALEGIYKPISSRLVSQILTPKAEQICQGIKNAAEKFLSCDKINNFIVTGRAVLLEGLLEMLESKLGVPVKLGRIAQADIISCLNKDSSLLAQSQKYLTFVTSLGIICQALSAQEPCAQPAYQTTRNPILNTIYKFKELYQEYF